MSSTAKMGGEPVRPVTDTEIEAYRRDGAVHLRGIMPTEWVGLIRDGVEEVRAQPSPLRGEMVENGSRTVAVQMAATLNEKLWRYVFESPAAAIAATLHGANQVNYHLDQLFYKEAGPVRGTDWHQDTPFLNVSGCDLVRVWLPVDPSPAELAVKMVRGSHRWNVTYQLALPEETAEIDRTMTSEDAYDFHDLVLDPRLPPLPDIAGQPDSFDIIGWDVEPGDAVVFDGHILHGSGGSPYHPLKRRALAVLYAGPEERWVTRPGRPVPDIAAIRGVSLEDGARLCDHPDVYPLAWMA